MSHFNSIKDALLFIDQHLDEQITFDLLAKRFHFSAYYFHRMFSLIVGKPIALYIKDRRMLQACMLLSSTKKSVLEIGLRSGYHCAQSFSRAFQKYNGLSPSKYRAQGLTPVIVTADEMIIKFTNRLQGGVYLNPKIIKQKKLFIAGVSGEGSKTGEVWMEFERRAAINPPAAKLSENGYEARISHDEIHTVHVGNAVSEPSAASGYEILELPESTYASFDVYVAKGYESENQAMDEWLQTNPEGYTEKLLDSAHYCVEFYDERFNGNEAGSIVEIWIPIEKK